jgi:hypothetical protein
LPSGSSTAEAHSLRPARRSRAGRTGAAAPRRTAATLLALGALLAGGCGSDGDASAGTESERSTPRPRALTQAEVLSVQLRTPRPVVLARLGPPSASGPPRLGTDRCLYWRIVGQPRTALWRLCFRNGRLHIISSYIV